MDRGEWQVGRVTKILAQTWENGAPKGGKIFSSTPRVCTQTAQIFVENSNVGEKHKKFRPPDPTSKLALGCWPIHLSLVTCHSRGRGGGAKTVKRPPQQPAQTQHTNCWAPLTRKWHILPHPAQPQHTKQWAPRTRKRHQQEHWPQRPVLLPRRNMRMVTKQQPDRMSHRGCVRGGPLCPSLARLTLTRRSTA